MIPFIVAEIGATHNGSLERALATVDAAKEAGADAIKLQTWSEMTVSDAVIESGPWAGRRLRELYEACKLPWDWHAPIFARARALGLVPFSTPFDAESVEFLKGLGCPIYKIASFEITHLPLIAAAGSAGMPVVISTGMATEEEIEIAVETASKAGASGVALLKCVSAYPAPAEDFNLIAMADMPSRFNCESGLSDHTQGSAVAIAATALGATVIEKHLSLDREGPDGGFATLPNEFATMVHDVRLTAQAIGYVRYGPVASEESSLFFRRSLWLTKDVKVGEELTSDNVAILRPRGGLAPEHFESVLGERLKYDAPRGSALTRDMLALPPYEAS